MKRIKNKVKAVIFDMDGTIVKTEHLWAKATESLLRRKGFVAKAQGQREFLESLSGIGLLESAKALKKEFKLQDSIESLAAEAKMIAHQLFEGGIEFIDGFEAFHQRLQQHLILTSVATNAAQASLRVVNEQMNLERFFGKNLFCIEMIGNKAKPDPAIFLHAAKQLNVEPHECVVFEDSVFGFQAAQAAGMKCIAIKNGLNKDNLDLVCKAIDSYHEAEEALIKLPFSAKSISKK